MRDLRPVTDDARRCPAKQRDWPEAECDYPAGHDGEHWNHRYPHDTWKTGKR